MEKVRGFCFNFDEMWYRVSAYKLRLKNIYSTWLNGSSISKRHETLLYTSSRSRRLAFSKISLSSQRRKAWRVAHEH